MNKICSLTCNKQEAWESSFGPTASCEHTAHSTLGGALQGVSRRSPGRSCPQELGRHGRMRQPEGWVREIPHTSNSIRRHLYVSTRPSAGGLRRRRGRQPMLHTSRPAMLTQLLRGAEGGSTRVVLLQLCLGIRAPTQGIFQYNNVLGSPSQGITTTYRRSFAQLWP